jgi:hypothetical protein
VWECGFWGFWGPAALSLVGSSIREVFRGWMAKRLLRRTHAKTKKKKNARWRAKEVRSETGRQETIPSTYVRLLSQSRFPSHGDP